MSTAAPSTDDTAEAKKDTPVSEEDGSVVTQSFPPSHILDDGRFIYLPPPNEFERSKFFERSIAKYGLLESDMATTKPKEEEEEEDASKNQRDDNTAPKVHPLAVASARLQAAGIAELNRAINLSTLVNTGEYFGLTNIVDPALDLAAVTAAATAKVQQPEGDAADKKAEGDKAEESTAAPSSTPAAASAPVTATPAAQKELQEEQRVKNAHILKRKRAVFDKASRVLQRHQSRLQAAVAAQAVPDQRLRQLRPQWRLVAPEHGTRAKPHAVRPTEVVAIDVDVYDPTGASGGIGSSLAGRLSSQVPRYATVELTEEYNTKLEEKAAAKKTKTEDDNKEEDAMDVDDEPVQKDDAAKSEDEIDDDDKTNSEHRFSECTMAEPFAIADPTLGKISTDFDPNKVTFLTLQFDIEKPSTGFTMSSCLEPMITTTIEKLKEKEKKDDKLSETEAKKEPTEGEKPKEEEDKKLEDHHLPDDEQVLVSLQHSLFCAKLFEAIRIEIMGDDEDEDESAAARQQKQADKKAAKAQNHQSVVWLSSEQEENFLPPPSVMVQPSNSSGAPLCVVHCHASEVKVQLDSEYTLRAKLVEADEQRRHDHAFSGVSSDTTHGKTSGSQTPEQLLVLCRSLLLHTQEVYHKHSLQESFAAAEKQREEEAKKLEAHKPRGLDRIQKKDVRRQPKILQNVVGLGTKLLFEQRVRKVLVRVRHWLKKRYPNCENSLKSEWLSLSVFDQHSRFCLSFGNLVTVDVTIVRDEITLITRDISATITPAEGTSGAYRKATFHSDSEFEIFLKLELRRQVKRLQTQQQQQAAAVGTAPIPVQ